MGLTTGYLTKGYTATTAVGKRVLVKFGAADGAVVPAAAATDLIIGVSTEIDTAIGERCDVLLVGNIGEVIAGGTIARGDMLTSNASGAAITTVTAGNRYVGIAEVSGVAGDIISFIVAPGLI